LPGVDGINGRPGVTAAEVLDALNEFRREIKEIRAIAEACDFRQREWHSAQQAGYTSLKAFRENLEKRRAAFLESKK
jgi:hypothetical protein